MSISDETFETDLIGHYGGDNLLASIEAGVTALGKSPESVTIEDLAPVDEFHIGGRPATIELCDRLGVAADAQVLDVGCGIGGAARFVAKTFNCEVTGVDIAPNYIDIARILTGWTGLEDSVGYEAASALDMPFDEASFDHAIQLHVAMNIEDKTALFSEVCRTLRPGGSFGVYDIMHVGAGEIDFPMPWAADESMSFVRDLPTYQAALEAAGFEISQLRNRGEFAVDFFAAMKAKVAQLGGPPPLGLHLILGANAPAKLANMISAIQAGTIAPVEIICHKPAAS
jgi:ubiquinone/menaquinone biosynthesis C-methylase UbiE